MKSVRTIAEEIVSREGGYVNDPSDPGGATNFGVTVQTMRRLGLDLDLDGTVGIRDVRLLTRPQAVEIFVEHYFYRPGIARLPEALRASVFDMYVNAGSNAVKILQQLLCTLGHAVTVDGVIGPMTVQAAEAAAEGAPDHIADAYGIARRNYYFRLADRRPTSRKFAKAVNGSKGGWIRRAEEFISPRFHLTEAEFQARVSSWG